jgi:hypothetical protein
VLKLVQLIVVYTTQPNFICVVIAPARPFLETSRCVAQLKTEEMLPLSSLQPSELLLVGLPPPFIDLNFLVKSVAFYFG